MKSNLTESPFRQYSKLPKSWPARPRLINYDKADPAIHYEDGWRAVVFPDYDVALQRLGELIFDEENDHFTYAVIDKSAEELEAERKAMIPASITPSQGRIMLIRMNIFDSINQIIENSNDVELKTYWEYSLSWDRYSQYVLTMANLIGMNDDDLDSFFIDASQII